MRSLIIATANKGKFEEIKRVLADEFGEFHSLNDFPERIEVSEDRPTYLENAWKKARKIGDRYDMPTLADDSGLEVQALGGRPGIHSSRYGTSDSDRIERLLKELKGVPPDKRGAVFRAYLAYYVPKEERVYFFYGSLRGYIALERRGEKGFGFDPVFVLPDAGKSLAEISMDEKNRISHRGRALESFRKFLSEIP